MGSRIDAEREGYARGAKTEVAIARTRATVASVGADLQRDDVAAQVSARVPDADLFVIEPAESVDGRSAPEATVVCDLNAQTIEATPGADGLPAAEAGFHAAIYRDAEGVGGIVSVVGDAAAQVAASEHTTTSAAGEDGVQVVTGATGTAVTAPSLDVAAAAVLRIIATTGDDAR